MKKLIQTAMMIAMAMEAKGVFAVTNILKSEELKNQLETLMNSAKEIENKEGATAEEISNIATEITNIKAAIKAQEALENAMKDDESAQPLEPKDQKEAVDLKNMFQTGQLPENAVTTTTGAGVIYKELSKKIIKLLKDRSSAFGFFNSTSIKGIARIPIQATSGNAVWADENLDPSATTEPTINVLELGQNRLYKESAITQQMINTEELDLEQFLAEDISEAMMDAVELGIFQGSGTKQLTGLIGGVPTGNKINLAVRGTISIDDFKKCKAKVKKSKQKDARWFMNADTFLEVDLLKDTTGRPLLQPDVTSATGYSILNIPVDITDAMPSFSTVGATTLVILATPDAYHHNEQKDIALYVYRDSTFTRKGLIGYAADMYLDGKPKDTQGLAAIVNKA